MLEDERSCLRYPCKIRLSFSGIQLCTYSKPVLKVSQRDDRSCCFSGETECLKPMEEVAIEELLNSRRTLRILGICLFVDLAEMINPKTRGVRDSSQRWPE